MIRCILLMPASFILFKKLPAKANRIKPVNPVLAEPIILVVGPGDMTSLLSEKFLDQSRHIDVMRPDYV